jgi:hypothetical protein
LSGGSSHRLPEEVIHFRHQGNGIETSAKCFVCLHQFGHAPSRQAILFDSLLNCFDQILVPERLDQKRHCPGSHCPNTHRDIAMAGDKYNGNLHGDLSHSGLQIKPAQSRQVYIEHQAAGHIGALTSQEVLS